ncbi:egl nine homolog 1-like [Acanthaster planci]|uniref:hypoxia-inducible factor-proline dioxygenase n=1 Tax=Acanthaster planci TaxID=133434 RepID=A0A8B7YXE7_ACAPL|nr:egl nine homolog 1-like [Acanthaster planci]
MAESVKSSVGSCACCKSTENLKRCSKCKSVFYCSREHQLQDWKKHKRYCKKISSQESTCMVDDGAHAQLGNVSAAAEQEHDKHWVIKGANVPNHSGSVNTNSKCYSSRDVVKSADSKTSTANPVKFSKNNTNEKKKLSSQREQVGLKVKHDKDGTQQNGSKSSTHFDSRPFIQMDFPLPESRDRDAMARHTTVHLQRNGYCVLDSFLASESSRSILREVKSIQDSGVLIDGPLSGGRTSSEKSQKFIEKAIRGDKITWLQGNEACYPSISALASRMDELIQRLNYYLQDQYVISGRTKAMVACYPGNGAGYACHVDNPNRDGRCITCLYYLNDNWDVEKQGGLLRLFPVSGGYVDVEPLLNRLLLFWSDRRNPHEVQPAFDKRYAITIWYFDKKEREEAKMAQLNEDMSKLRGEVCLPDVKSQKERQDRIEQEIQETSSKAVAGLSHLELQGLSAMLEGQPDPRAVLTQLGVAPTIQDALLRQLKEMKSSGDS